VRGLPVHGGAEAYFFPAGEAGRLEQARYAVLRVDGKGGAVLQGLADHENRKLR
jgi:uncharacterized membrane-anchored protein